MVTDYRWWATIGVLSGMLLMWVVFPRYETSVPITHGLGFVVLKSDRWTGRVEWMRLSPETVRRYQGGALSSDGRTEMVDTSFDGDERRLNGLPRNRARFEDIIEVIDDPK